MKLRFYARTGNFVPDPRQAQRAQGEAAMFVGRDLIPSDNPREPVQLVASKEGTTIDSDQVDPERLAATLRDVKREGLWCADKATADFCQVPFVELEYDEKAHLWSPKPEAKKTSGGKS